MARPRVEGSPAVQSDALKIYISSRMRAGSLDLHSAFQLEYEATRIGRFAYRQPAWGHHLYLHGFFAMFMLGLTARALKCDGQFDVIKRWYSEDLPLLKESRRHLLADHLHLAEELFCDSSFLHEIAKVRRVCLENIATGKEIPDELDPSVLSVFPYDYAAPEAELLRPGTCKMFDRNVPLDAEVEELLVELGSTDWR